MSKLSRTGLVGGMEGTEEEAVIFRRLQGVRPRYAIASTGSAAQIMYKRAPMEFSGSLQDRSCLEDYPVSYSLVARRILDDMGISPTRTKI